MRIQKCLISLLALAGCLAMTGCADDLYSPTITNQPSFSISIEQLASRLSLTVKTAAGTYFELTNANNRVLLFTYDGGKVHVNGKIIGEANATVAADGKTYVSQLLVPTIRGHLVTSYTPSPDYKIPSGSGFASGTVVLDPGHGGKDPGAQSVLGYWEKGVNLQISRKVKSYLEDSGVKVVMTRNGDSYPELEERAALANRINADLFVSIHCNTIGNSSHRGYIIFTARSSSWASKKTARNIANELSSAGVPGKGIRNQDYRVLVQTRCPAVLIECGFMSNYDEADNLDDDWYQDKLARAIAQGIIQSL